MLPQLETARLDLVPVSQEHFDLLVELNSDPQVTCYKLGRPATRAETLAEWEQRLVGQSDLDRDLGYWAGFARDEFIGWWSASSFSADPTVSGIGYRLRRQSWGVGYATEGARTMVAHAFSVAGISRVAASTRTDNHASWRVLEKVGLRHVETRFGEHAPPLPGQGTVVFELRRDNWAAP